MVFASGKWDGAASNYKSTDDYCKACAIDMNENGKPKVQAMCKLPIKTPDGDYSTRALVSAQGVLLGAMGGVDAPMAEKVKAARKIASLMRQAKMEPNPGLVKMAGQ
jgi:hypothetical protein